MVLSSKGDVVTGFSCLSALISTPPVIVGCKKPLCSAVHGRESSRPVQSFLGKGCKKFAGKKKK